MRGVEKGECVSWKSCERRREVIRNVFCNLKGVFFMGVFIVHSPPQAGTPQSSASQRAASDQDSDCVPIQVRPQPSRLHYGEIKPHVCLFTLKSDPGGSGSAGGH